MIPGGDEEHTADEKRDTRDEIRPMKRKKEDAERKDVNDGERKSKQNRNARTVRKRNRPIAREREHPASSSVEIRCGAKPSRSRAIYKYFFSVGMRRKTVN